jgi:hypothetical protein
MFGGCTSGTSAKQNNFTYIIYILDDTNDGIYRINVSRREVPDLFLMKDTS